MSLNLAIRLSEILLALSFIQHSLEHLSAAKDEQRHFGIRIALSCLLIAGFYSAWVCVGLLVNASFILLRFRGPYNGGSDRMGLLILCCLSLVHFMPSEHWREIFFGYLGLQLMLSYFISGWVKVVNPDWRSGRALKDVFMFSGYPASEGLRAWAQWPKRLFLMSWGVILFELAFPFSLLTQTSLLVALAMAAIFHLANAFIFGLNRFLWVWLAAYPSIIWLQARIVEAV